MFRHERLKGTSDASPERALVTGATSGIGRATALRLAGRGATVCLVGRNENAAETLRAQIEDMGCQALVILTDVSDGHAVERAVRNFAEAYGGIDTVVASAGIAPKGNATETSIEDWKQCISINLDSVFYLARFAMPELIKTQGTFTIISSDAGMWGDSDFAAYIASKHGVHGLMKSLALDYGRYGVRTNAVCPGFVETPMADKLLANLSPEKLEALRKAVPLARFAQPEDVADVVAHLSSDAARHTNGTEYRLDGGKTCGHYKP
ncbi:MULTISPECIES: SDR family NAD(P)-dependent oxidoreductase [unclassified Sphingobium]|uniref:SDR family NAD(P)-dependent oxidoreductase n=1 Tax=unclassified Sphingobium TaxID=2611147 RepID=UPI00191AF3F8|nr:MULTISPECIES: SDR family oxidoreductase [unclassified Sphingobium]CAD7339775.1 2,5-dichloro-2,5-cyclohexadiene-1,4-diol dehydrogenase LinX [Sphingobium sp. S8]CAD7340531.1 2,5-dichloro-2,5-cyclohexadiene-1,4-diol dehydrogenase LinX [Sphingobium sp. S6]